MKPGDLYTFRGGDGIAYYLATGAEHEYVGAIGFPPDSLMGREIATAVEEHADDEYNWGASKDEICGLSAMVDNIVYHAYDLLPKLASFGRPHPASQVGMAQVDDPAIMEWMWFEWEWNGGTVEQAEERLMEAARVLSGVAREKMMAR